MNATGGVSEPLGKDRSPENTHSEQRQWMDAHRSKSANLCHDVACEILRR